MNFSRQQRQMILPIVILVLGVVLIWWMWIWPRTSVGKAYRREAKLKEKLQSIRPPAEVQSGKIQIIHLQSPDSLLAMRIDLGQSDCTAGGTHYGKELSNAGFGYNGEQIDSEKHTRTFSFAASDYDAKVVCNEFVPHVFLYGITMRTKE